MPRSDILVINLNKYTKFQFKINVAMKQLVSYGVYTLLATVNTFFMNFDFTKYGFELFKDEGDGYFVWRLNEKNTTSFIEVIDNNGMITITSKDTHPDTFPHTLACRYECRDYKDVEFLLFNGRIKYLFFDIISKSN